MRLLASSANLTRRAYAGNLEVAGVIDFEIGGRGPRSPSLYALRVFLDALADGSTLRTSPAFELIRSHLPTEPGRRRAAEMEFVHTVDPVAFRKNVTNWLNTTPENAGEYVRSLVVSPFYSAQAPDLHAFWRDDLRFKNVKQHPIDLVVDGREIRAEDVRAGSATYGSPPAWFEQYRGEGSVTYRPAVITKRHDGERRGTGQAGRALHAKLIGVGYRRARARTDRMVWRILLGSSNFTEGGMGLAGAQSNLEAGFLVEHEDRVEGDFLGVQPVESGLCAVHEPSPADPERAGADLSVAVGAITRAKRALQLLDEGKIEIVPLAEGGYRVRIDLSTLADHPSALEFGTETFAVVGPGAYEITVPSLAPYYVALRYGDMRFSWPIPMTLAAVEISILSQAGARRRIDRLMDYWLRHGATVTEPDDDDLDGDASFERVAMGDEEEPGPGSWQINRLLLGLRRRLAESIAGVPPRLPSASSLVASIRVRELLTLSDKLEPADRLYFGTLARATLLGYVAGQAKRRGSIDDTADSETIQRWRADDLWLAFEQQVKNARRGVGEHVLEALDRAAEELFASVRDAEVVS